MRGKAVLVLFENRHARITPAYAGKSLTHPHIRHSKRDHPRLCGEKSCILSAAGSAAGSPPPMRGKGSMTTPLPPCFRITPAYAGKSAPLRQCQGSSRDHPRLCGEKTFSMPSLAVRLGSPPPMRGKGRSLFRCIRQSGITPAYAGKSVSEISLASTYTDHPRLCGEKRYRTYIDSKVKGSPPPMRGKDLLIGCVCLCLRITPAYAGKSSWK